MTDGLLICQIRYGVSTEDAKDELWLILRESGYNPDNLAICDWPREAKKSQPEWLSQALNEGDGVYRP